MAEVRVDKYLFAMRIYKTRSIAADACKNGRVKLNGVDYPSSFLSHSQLMEGGVLEFIMSDKPGDWGTK